MNFSNLLTMILQLINKFLKEAASPPPHILQSMDSPCWARADTPALHEHWAHSAT